MIQLYTGKHEYELPLQKPASKDIVYIQELLYAYKFLKLYY